jgi:hypothetical protein
VSPTTGRVKTVSSLALKAKAKKRAVTLTITVKASGIAKPSGYVRVKDGSKTIKKKLKFKNGKAVVKIKKASRGKHAYKVSYAGDNNTMPATAVTKRIRVK